MYQFSPISIHGQHESPPFSAVAALFALFVFAYLRQLRDPSSAANFQREAVGVPPYTNKPYYNQPYNQPYNAYNQDPLPNGGYSNMGGSVDPSILPAYDGNGAYDNDNKKVWLWERVALHFWYSILFFYRDKRFHRLSLIMIVRIFFIIIFFLYFELFLDRVCCTYASMMSSVFLIEILSSAL